MSIMELDLQKLSKKESFFNKDNSLVDFIVPFVNNDNPLVLLNELFVKYQKYKTGCPQYILDENHSLFLASSEKTEEVKALAIKMRNLYKDMIDVAYSENSKSNEECERLEKSIKNSLPRISWRNRKNCGDAKSLEQNTFLIRDEKTGKTYRFERFTPTNVRLLRGIITKLLVEAFNSNIYDEPTGFDYIGKCPQCGKIFIKKEPRNNYCSPTCSNTMRKNRYREKLNSSL